MKIIGHRGASGLALENTKESIQKALDLGVDAIEFDIRLTADRQIVLCHDADLSRISRDSDPRKIHELTYQEIRQIPLLNGEHLPLLEDILRMAGTTQVMIEVKVDDCAQELLDVLDQFPHVTAYVLSKRHREIGRLKDLRPNQRAYVAGFASPVEIIDIAKIFQADGLDINFWTINPLTYWLALRANLDIMAYTVNNPFMFWFIRLLYPKVAVCTDYPNRFLRKSRRRTAAAIAK